MNVLMIGFDESILRDDEPGRDSRDRHVKYAQALRGRDPRSRLTMLVRSQAGGSDRPLDIAEGLRVYPVPSRRPLYASAARRVVKHLAGRQSFDLVSTQTPFDDGVVGVWVKRALGIGLNVQMRASFLDHPGWIQTRPLVHHPLNRVGRWVAGRADTIRVVSHEERRRLSQLFPQLAQRIVALHPLVNTRTFDRSVTAEDLVPVHRRIASLGGGNRQIVLFAGRFVAQKNIPTLLKAFAIVHSNHPDAVLVLAGDGPLRTMLHSQAERQCVNHSIVWLGNTSMPDLRAWYAAARMVVLPSFYEGLPKVIAEAALMGRPAIAAPFPGASEVVIDGETGFVAADYTDHTCLADRIARLLIERELADHMGRKARDHVCQYLLPEPRYLEQLLALWERTACSRQDASR